MRHCRAPRVRQQQLSRKEGCSRGRRSFRQMAAGRGDSAPGSSAREKGDGPDSDGTVVTRRMRKGGGGSPDPRIMRLIISDCGYAFPTFTPASSSSSVITPE
jgi:hypothetical protein